MPKTLKMPDIESDDRLMTVADMQQFCHVSRAKAYDMLAEVPHLKIGGSIRIRRSALEAYLQSCEVGH